MRLLIVFVTILAMLPTLVRWTAQGKMSVSTAAITAVLLVFLLSMGTRVLRLMLPVVGLAAFGLQYADDGTLKSFWGAIAALLPLGIALFGFYIMFSGLRGNKRRYDD